MLGGVEAVPVEQVDGGAGLAEDVVHAELAQQHRVPDSAASTASPRPPMTECSSAVTTWPVLSALARTSSSSSGLMVWMLTTSAETPFSASVVGGGERLGDHEAGRDDGHVGALAQDDALAQVELVGVRVVEHGDREAAEAQVDGAVGLVGGAHGGLWPRRRRLAR